MEDQEPLFEFDQKRAASYDDQWAKLAPLNNAAHLTIRIILSDLPAEARVLCVGAGTGSEMIYLAHAFPEWQFTAVEPAAPMLAVCRQRAEENGIASRCTFHEGYLDSLAPSDPFDAATCLLVSHFLMQREAQRELFTQIASRLGPGGVLISSAIAADKSAETYPGLLEFWLRMQAYAGASAEDVVKMPASYERFVSVLPPVEVAEIIAASGFDAPVLFYQAFLIHAWHAKRRS